MKKRPASRLRAHLNALPIFVVVYGMPLSMVIILATLSGSFTILAPDPPRDQSNLCEIFRGNPQWYDAARESQQRWGTSIATQMAFVSQESSFRSHVSPPRTELFGFLPWRRRSSAYGYAQAQDPAWGEYMDDAGSLLAQRTQMKYALDFIGWYNDLSHRHVGIPFSQTENLYLAYHEGRTGFKRKSFRKKPAIQRVARKVAGRASRFSAQLSQCEAEFQCRHFYEVGPFCQIASG